MSLGRSLRPPAFAVCIALAALAAAPADAVEASRGSKNFTAPRYVPNYFSNEAGALRGGGTQADAAQPGGDPVVTAAAARRVIASRGPSRHHTRRTTRTHGRFALVRGKPSTHRHVTRARTAGSSKTSRPMAAYRAVKHSETKGVAAKRRPAPAKGKAVTAKRPPAPAKGKQLARAGG